MEKIDVELFKKKVFSSVVVLTGRTFILQVIAIVSNFILGILLSPQIFGIFFVVSAVIAFLSYFSDIGLAPSLIQKKEELTRDDLRTTFTIQQLLVGTSVLISLILSARLASFYKLDNAGLWLFRALAVSFFLSSLKTIPSILLERNLEFHKLVIPQIIETGSFYLVTIILAIFGFGVTSFTIASIVRGISGTLVIYLLYPWRIEVGISRSSAKKLLSFGIPYQTKSFIALLKDDLMTLFLGKILPLSQVGYIGWAKKWAEAPLKLIMDSVIKVMFPVYSRLQGDVRVLGKAVEKSVLFMSLFIFPLTLILVFIIRPLVYIIPRYLKWEPALTSFYLFAVASVLASFSSAVVNALDAIGKVKITFLLMIMWTVLTWLLIPVLVFYFGFNGVAIAAVIIGITSVFPALILRRYVLFSLYKGLIKPALGTIFMGIVLMAGEVKLGNSYPSMGFTLSMGLITYIIFIFITTREEILPYLRLFYSRK